MLEHFEILQEEEYKIKVVRENFWIPLVTPNKLRISVSLEPTGKATLIPKLFDETIHLPLSNFFTVIRENEKWRITTINLEQSELKEVFDTIKATTNVNKFVKITPEGFSFNRADINLNKMSSLEKRVLVHNLITALERLEENKE